MSARWMATVAFALLALRSVASVVGMDRWVSVISGTPPAGVSLEVAAVGAVGLVALHLLTVLLAPTLLIAAALRALWDRGDSARGRA